MGPQTARSVMKKIYLALLIICLLGYISAHMFPNLVWVMILLAIMAFLLLTNVIIRFKYWRCPHCGELLPSKGHAFYQTEHCHKCGKSIEE